MSDREELVDRIARWAGELQITISRMKPECWESEVLKIASSMAKVAVENSEGPMWISGMGPIDGGQT